MQATLTTLTSNLPGQMQWTKVLSMWIYNKLEYMYTKRNPDLTNDFGCSYGSAICHIELELNPRYPEYKANKIEISHWASHKNDLLWSQMFTDWNDFSKPYKLLNTHSIYDCKILTSNVCNEEEEKREILNARFRRQVWVWSTYLASACGGGGGGQLSPCHLIFPPLSVQSLVSF